MAREFQFGNASICGRAIKSDLIGLDNLRSYLQYWIDDIHAPTKIAEDAAWSAALATYITVYRYKGVLWLFDQFDRSISPDSTAFKGFLDGTEDRKLAQALAKAAKDAQLI